MKRWFGPYSVHSVVLTVRSSSTSRTWYHVSWRTCGWPTTPRASTARSSSTRREVSLPACRADLSKLLSRPVSVPNSPLLRVVRRFVPAAPVMSLNESGSDEKTIFVHLYEPFEITRIAQVSWPEFWTPKRVKICVVVYGDVGLSQSPRVSV